MNKRQWYTLGIVIIAMTLILSVAGYFTTLVDTRDMQSLQTTENPQAESTFMPSANSVEIPTAKSATKQSTRSTANPAIKQSVRQASKPSTKQSVKPTVAPVPKTAQSPVDNPSHKPTQKPSAKSATKSTIEPKIEMSKETEKLIALINQERNIKGLSKLKIDSTLMDLASKKANDMVTNNYFSHYSVSYGSPFDMMKDAGIKYKKAGENIGGNNNVKNCVNAWVGNESYSQNVYHKEYNYTGAAVVDSPVYGKIIVQLYIKK